MFFRDKCKEKVEVSHEFKADRKAEKTQVTLLFI